MCAFQKDTQISEVPTFRLTSTQLAQKHQVLFKSFLSQDRAGKWLEIFRSMVVPFLQDNLSTAQEPGRRKVTTV